MDSDTRMRLNNTLRGGNIGETVIRRMTRIANQFGAINLSQGFPDFDVPEPIKKAAQEAIAQGKNQYSYPFGIAELREAIAEKAARYNSIEADPATDITVTLGATEAIKSVLETITNPGDEVIFFEPFHEAYPAQAKLLRLIPKIVTLHAPTWTYEPSALESAVTNKTAAIILNTPHNPSGKVFSASELEHIAGICTTRNIFAITDEIYEHITFDGTKHTSLASLPGMKERTFTVNAISKTYSATGWRVGWVISPPDYSPFVRIVHDASVIQAPTPLQFAANAALRLGDEYYDGLAASYQEKRDFAVDGLRNAGFKVTAPKGAYYVMADFSSLDQKSASEEFAMRLITEAKVASVPGSNFYASSGRGDTELRFAFCKRTETLESALQNLDAFARSR